MSQLIIPSNQNQITEAWRQMSPPRKIGLGALVVVAIIGLVFFFTWAQTPTYAVAYTDLNTTDASAVVQYLQENNIQYQVSDNGATISVPNDQVYDVRLALAGQGVPSEGTMGMELFDTTNLGMTDFIQQVNYQRAMEGELARTISSLNSVKSARVHLVYPQDTLYTEEKQPTTASVVVELENGQSLNKEQVQAISHLVSSAVEGLTPANLTIVDVNGNVLANGSQAEDGQNVAMTATQLETQQSYERNLESRIQTMLSNVLGPDKAVVRVKAEMNWDQVESESETYTPGSPDGVLRSSREITEVTTSTDGTATGLPGTGSNIPDTAPSFQTEITNAAGGGYRRTDITRNFEVSRSTQKVIPASGTVERMSVSVMVDNITDTITLNAIEQATIAAAGIDTTRGDIVTVSSIPFDRTFQTEQSTAMEQIQQRDFYFQIAQWAAIIIAILALFFVVRSLQRSMRPPQPEILVETPALATGRGASMALTDPRAAAVSPAGATVPTDPRAALLDQVTRASEMGGLGADSILTIGPPTFSEEQKAAAEKAQMIRQLQLMAKNRSETLAQIIQFWLAEDGGGKA